MAVYEQRDQPNKRTKKISVNSISFLILYICFTISSWECSDFILKKRENRIKAGEVSQLPSFMCKIWNRGVGKLTTHSIKISRGCVHLNMKNYIHI